MDLAHEFIRVIEIPYNIFKVSILVLVDLAHEYLNIRCLLALFVKVSILVLVDLAHESTPAGGGAGEIRGFQSLF